MGVLNPKNNSSFAELLKRMASFFTLFSGVAVIINRKLPFWFKKIINMIYVFAIKMATPPFYPVNRDTKDFEPGPDASERYHLYNSPSRVDSIKRSGTN